VQGVLVFCFCRFDGTAHLVFVEMRSISRVDFRDGMIGRRDRFLIADCGNPMLDSGLVRRLQFVEVGLFRGQFDAVVHFNAPVLIALLSKRSTALE
jgi:hypothetical protein